MKSENLRKEINMFNLNEKIQKYHTDGKNTYGVNKNSENSTKIWRLCIGEREKEVV